MASPLIAGPAGAISSTDRRDLRAGNCGSDCCAKRRHSQPDAEAESAWAMALGPGTHCRRRGLHHGGRTDRRSQDGVVTIVCRPSAAAFVFVGCGEELGWRGWLLPRLLTTYRPAAATAIIAAVWGFWHMPILLTGSRIAAPFLFGIFGLSFLFTALWERMKGNIFVLAVAHASVNAPLSMLNEQSVTNAVFVVYGVLGLAAAILIARRDR